MSEQKNELRSFIAEAATHVPRIAVEIIWRLAEAVERIEKLEADYEQLREIIRAYGGQHAHPVCEEGRGCPKCDMMLAAVEALHFGLPLPEPVPLWLNEPTEEAADEIERLRAERDSLYAQPKPCVPYPDVVRELVEERDAAKAEIERIRAAVKEIRAIRRLAAEAAKER